MSEEKQIEEMAKCCTYYHEGECLADTTHIEKCDLMCEMFGVFTNLEKEGYRKQSEWISVDERLPKEGVDVLVALKFFDRVSVDTDRIHSGRWFGYGPLRGVQYVTHWMPFPEPPKMKGGE